MLADLDREHASARKRAPRTQALGEKARGEFLESTFGHGGASIGVI